jgi:general secretion pathway protein N
MKAWPQLLAAGVAAYALFFVSALPATKVLPYVQQSLPEIDVQGVSGTVWSGRAARLSAGAVTLDSVTWHWRPLGLFKGAVEFAVEAGLGGQPFAARVGTDLFGGHYVSDVVGRISASDLLYMSGMNMARLAGGFDIHIDRVEGIGAGLPAAAGTVSWSPAKVLEPMALDLGKVHLETRIEDGRTLGNLAADGGALLFSGELQASPDGNYRIVGEARKKGAIPQAVDGFLASFAEFSNGVYRLEWSDQVPLR